MKRWLLDQRLLSVDDGPSVNMHKKLLCSVAVFGLRLVVESTTVS